MLKVFVIGIEAVKNVARVVLKARCVDYNFILAAEASEKLIDPGRSITFIESPIGRATRIQRLFLFGEVRPFRLL